MLYTSPWSRFELTTSVVIGTDCIGSCKSNYQVITATTGHIYREARVTTDGKTQWMTWLTDKYIFMSSEAAFFPRYLLGFFILFFYMLYHYLFAIRFYPLTIICLLNRILYVHLVDILITTLWKRKLKQCWSSISPILIKRTTTSHLN
jgi:hypothetical protein